MKVCFAPYYKSNPYQTKLEGALAKLNIDVKLVNAKTKSLYDKRVTEADIIHFHWIEPYYLSDKYVFSIVKSTFFLIWLRIFSKNKKIVWTVHNLVSHSNKFSRLEKFIVKKFIHLVDAFSVHNEYTKSQLVLQYGADINKMHLIKHANYVNAYQSNPLASIKLRDELSISETDVVFMFLGYIRPYKGVFELIKSFKKSKSKKIKLIVAGKVSDENDYIFLKDFIDNDSRITLRRGFIEDNEIASFLDISDVMVYPYRDILTSGSLFLGMSYRKCCIATNIGSMPEFLSNEFLYSKEHELTEMIERLSILTKDKLDEFGTTNYQSIASYDWNYMASETQKMYKECLKDDQNY